MSIASLVGLTEAEKNLEAMVPGILDALKDRETQALAAFQKTIDEVNQTIEGVKDDVAAVQVLIASINTTVVPGVASIVQSIEKVMTRLDAAAKAFGGT